MKFSTGIILVGVLSIALTTSGIETILATEADTKEVSEVGVTTVDVGMTYTDEYGNYIPTDDFTVTIPKTFNMNPKEDFIYDINVKGIIDEDRDVWVCSNTAVNMTLTDETLESTYGISKTQTLKNTIDKIQYSSEEIKGAEGYTQQGIIHKSSLDYEIEAEYTGTLNFYINVISKDDIYVENIQQNGLLRTNNDMYLSILKKNLPDEVYTSCEARMTSVIDDYFSNYYSDASAYNSNYVILEVKYSTGNTSGNPYNYCDITFYVTKWNGNAVVTRGSTVANGKYYYTYTTDVVSNKQGSLEMHLRQPLSRTDYCTPTGDWYYDYGGGSTATINRPITTTDNLSVDLYISPGCKFIIE